ncbi:MAG: hypothetical protein PHW33_03965 [Candidatus Portnoybacteria bacterium]|nr:hypothetical protein [Candidatus Portnoybacteria bacterium]
MSFVKYSDGEIKKIISSPLSPDELSEQESRKKLEKKSEETKEPEKPSWAE